MSRFQLAVVALWLAFAGIMITVAPYQYEATHPLAVSLAKVGVASEEAAAPFTGQTSGPLYAAPDRAKLSEQINEIVDPQTPAMQACLDSATSAQGIIDVLQRGKQPRECDPNDMQRIEIQTLTVNWSVLMSRLVSGTVAALILFFVSFLFGRRDQRTSVAKEKCPEE